MSPLPAILFAFLNHPMMLWWLAAAAAPLVIHLLNRRKYREVSWAAMQFLVAAMRKNSRRILIEQWLLLAVRTLIIVLAVFAVAEPFLEQSGLKSASGQRTHKVLIIDGSFSMAYRPADRSRFDRAKELAGRIVDESDQGDGFTLVLLADPPRVIVGTPAFEPSDFHEELENLRLPHGGADLPATLVKVEQILQIARREHARLINEEVYLITDLGRNTWDPDWASPAAAAEFLQRSQRLGANSALLVVDLGQPDSENAAITRLATEEPYATVARDVTLEADIRNFGRQALNRQLVELHVDNRRAGEQYVDIEPGGQQTVAFPYRFDTPGDHAVEVRLAPDLLDIDNHRWLAVPVKEQLRVLCVDGKPSGGDFRGAADYLAVALSPGTDSADRAMVRAEIVPESALQELDLPRYDAVFLANVGQFTASEARILESYLQGGGGLVFFLGDRVQPDRYNHLLGGGPDGVNILPAKIGALAGESQYRFDPLDYQHPLLAAFRGQQRSGLLTTPVQQYFRLDTTDIPRAKTALGFDNGDPAIVEAPYERGQVILVATSADISWTTMPMWTSYVPLVQELLALAVRGQAEDRNSTVGQALAGLERTLATQTPVSVRTPTGETSTLRLVADGPVSRWSFNDTLFSGIYAVSLGPPLERNEIHAINVDTSESDLAKLDPEDLNNKVWPNVRFRTLTDWQDLSHEPTEQIARQSRLHQYLLAAVLLLLLFESGLALYLGRRAI